MERWCAIRDDLEIRGGADEIAIERKWLDWTRIDSDCFEFVYWKYRVPIFGMLCRSTLDEQLALVLTQDTFVRAYEKLHQFQWRGKTVKGWLYTIGSRLAARHWNDEKKRRNREQLLVDLHFGVGETPEELLARRETAILLHDTMGRLPEKYRAVLALYYWEGLTTSEIAVVMNRRPNTVKGWLKRARDKLAVLLGEGDSSRPAAMVTQALELDPGMDFGYFGLRLQREGS